MKRDTQENLPPPNFLFFPLNKPLSHYISLFLSKINPPLSGQISDEILYTWCDLAYRSQSKPN